MKNKGNLCARHACTIIFQKVAKAKKNKRHHLKRMIAKMEVVSNLCASKKTMHKDHARGTWCAHGGASWGMNHKSGHREKILSSWNEKGRRTFCAHRVKCQNMKSIYKNKYGLYMPLSIPSEPWECVHGFHNTIFQIESDGHHFGSSKLIFQIGKNGSNKDDCNNIWFNKVVL